MTQLQDLDDDCLLEVLDLLSANDLFKMLSVNKRMKRLATEKMRTKIRAIVFCTHKDSMFSTCSHLGAIRKDQVLFLEELLKNSFGNEPPKLVLFLLKKESTEASKQALISSVLSKCPAVKCFDSFHLSKPMPDGLLMEVVRRCPQIECLKLGQSVVSQAEWNKIFELIGHRIVHLVKYKPYIRSSADFKKPMPTDTRLLETVAKKCPNIKRIDWVMSTGYLNKNLVAVLKMLPDDCWIALDSYDFESFENSEIKFKDVVDELNTKSWNWSHFKHRVSRLSSLTWTNFRDELVVRGVEFAGLKKLDVSGCPCYDNDFVDCLVASKFPQLEEFRFDVTSGFKENNFDALFQRMKSVKKLVIFWNNESQFKVSHLPGSAINHLMQLEAIEFTIWSFPRRPLTILKVDVFLQKLEQYVNDIRSLKKLAVYVDVYDIDDWKEKIEGFKEKHNQVEDFFYKKL